MGQVKLRERRFPATKISQCASQHRPRAHHISSRLMMKSHRQLNQPLHMQLERRVRQHHPPSVLESLVSLEKVGVIEKLPTFAKVGVIFQSHSQVGHTLSHFLALDRPNGFPKPSFL
jgi:hypothetical protein